MVSFYGTNGAAAPDLKTPRSGRGRDGSSPALRTDPYVRNYRIRLLPRFVTRSPLGKDERYWTLAYRSLLGVHIATTEASSSGSTSFDGLAAISGRPQLENHQTATGFPAPRGN